MKKIWITTDWESNILQSNHNRLGRMNSLADYLAKKGYKVTLWFTTFEHPQKKYIENGTKIVLINPMYRIVLIHTKHNYKKNISIKRLFYYYYMSKEMKKMMMQEKDLPDVILCSYPPEQYCRIAEKIGKKYGIPVIVDVRDMWPKIFERAFPKIVRIFAKLFLLPMETKAKQCFKRAEVICAMSMPELKYGLELANRKQNELDQCIFIGNEKIELPNKDYENQLYEWNRLGISKKTWNICLFCTLSPSILDMETLFSAVEEVHSVFPEIRLIIGGKGDAEEYYRKLVSNKPYIVLNGWMNQKEMISIMNISKAGLMNYHNTVDFKDGWGNKVSQYFSYKLPLITSASGVSKEYVEKYECGIYYKEGDINGLVNVLISLINDKDYQRKLSNNAFERFKIDFDNDIVNKKFESMILKTYDLYRKK